MLLHLVVPLLLLLPLFADSGPAPDSRFRNTLLDRNAAVDTIEIPPRQTRLVCLDFGRVITTQVHRLGGFVYAPNTSTVCYAAPFDNLGRALSDPRCDFVLRDERNAPLWTALILHYTAVQEPYSVLQHEYTIVNTGDEPYSVEAFLIGTLDANSTDCTWFAHFQAKAPGGVGTAEQEVRLQHSFLIQPRASLSFSACFDLANPKATENCAFRLAEGTWLLSLTGFRLPG